MTLIAPQERLTAKDAAPGTGAGSPPAHEIKYRQDAANYVAAMLAELRQIAGKAGFEKLVGSIDAAYYEAYGLMKYPAPKPGEKSELPLEPKSL